VAVGALQADINYINDGFVRVYRFNDAAHAYWTRLAEDIVGEAFGDRSGSSVRLSSDGNILAIGAKYNDGEDQDAVGHVRVYQYRNDNADTWTQLGEDIDGLTSWELSGSSVALSADGLVVAISSPSADSFNAPCSYNTGLVRVYHYNNTADTWLQVGLPIGGELCGDESGDSISLSSSGDIVAIGAVQNDGNNSDWKTNSGHVRIFKYSRSTSMWIQLGMDIDGTPGARYGQQVSIDASGNTVAVGTSGDVRIYRLATDLEIR
jgi:WD40 repeat protein